MPHTGSYWQKAHFHVETTDRGHPHRLHLVAVLRLAALPSSSNCYRRQSVGGITHILPKQGETLSSDSIISSMTFDFLFILSSYLNNLFALGHVLLDYLFSLYSIFSLISHTSTVGIPPI